MQVGILYAEKIFVFYFDSFYFNVKPIYPIQALNVIDIVLETMTLKCLWKKHCSVRNVYSVSRLTRTTTNVDHQKWSFHILLLDFLCLHGLFLILNKI